MPSMRRMRVFAVVVLSAVIYILYLTGRARSSRSPDFYLKTKQALEREKSPFHPHTPHKRIGIIDDDDEALYEQLTIKAKEAEQAAGGASKENILRPENQVPKEEKAKQVVEDIEPGKSDTANEAAEKKKHGTDGAAEKAVEKEDETQNHLVEQEMNSILKRSPIIIFSKSFCPHSKRAKDILLEKYTIVPAPYVVELDEHPLGAEIQAKLADTTGRRTVPNVLINGKSIGGGDDVAELDQRMTLIDKIKSLGGKQMVKVEEKHM